MKKRLLTTMLAAMMTVSTFAAAVPVHAESTGRQDMYRLYNPNSGEHFYTASVAERDYLDQIGWNYEGIGWTAPAHSDTPVYRLYNPNAGDHHYTVSTNERDNLVSLGWNYEGIGWYSDDAQSVPLYRQYNPNATTGSHNYTTSKQENDYLAAIGWNAEGIGWYGIGDSGPSGSTQTTSTPHTGGGSSSGGSAVQECQHNWVPQIQDGKRIRIGGHLPKKYWFSGRTFIVTPDKDIDGDTGMIVEEWYPGETYTCSDGEVIEPYQKPVYYVSAIDWEAMQKDSSIVKGQYFMNTWALIYRITGYKCSKCGATK